MVLAAYWGLLVKIVHCISDSYKAELEKEEDTISKFLIDSCTT